MTLAVLNFLSPERHPAPLEPHHFQLLAAYASLAGLSQILLVGSIHLFEAIISPLALVLPRNMFLLWTSTLGRHGLPLRNNWAQMIFVLPLATIGWFVTDTEFAGAWRMLTATTNWGHQRLRPYNSLPLSESAPSSPSAAITPKEYTVTRAVMSPFLALLPLLPLAVYLLQFSAGASSLSTACALLPAGVRSSLCAPKSWGSTMYASPAELVDLASTLDRNTVDLVFSYYNEDMDDFKNHVDNIRKVTLVAESETRVFVYNKGSTAADKLRTKLRLTDADAVVDLPNLGREGATYLEHILAHYNDTASVLAGTIAGLATTHESPKTFADHTFFLQPHLAWHWIAQPRLNRVGTDTGFAHLGPMMKNWCGRDDRGVGEYPFVKEFYNMFVQDLCPPEGVLSAWSAQFVASRRRIMSNPYHRYAKVAELMEAPEGHWLHGVSPNLKIPALAFHAGCVEPTCYLFIVMGAERLGRAEQPDVGSLA